MARFPSARAVALATALSLSVSGVVGDARPAVRIPPVSRRLQYYPDATDPASAGPPTSSSVNVNLPSSLHKANGYAHSDALFGEDVLGMALSEKVYSAGGTLCDEIPHTAFVAPYMLIARRGNCTFVHKARNAQNMGATALIIADHTCSCPDKEAHLCNDDKDPALCEPVEATMSDDGSGGDIRIPVVMLKKQDGDAIIDYLDADLGVVSVSLSFPVPHQSDTVNWALWSTPMSTDDSAVFKTSFGPIAQQFGQKAFFEPFYFIYSGDVFACTYEDGTGEHPCGDLCTNHGRYCFPDPDGIHDYGLSGADIVRESLRQKCIYEEYGNTNAAASEVGVASKWWAYIAYFQQNCDNEDSFNNADCITRAMDEAGVDPHRIDNCVMASGGFGDNDGANDILEREMTQKVTQQISVLPTYTVNGAPMRGRIRSYDVFMGLCAGYAAYEAPQPLCSCTAEPSAAAIETCAGIGAPDTTKKTTKVVKAGMSGGTVFGIMLAVLAVVGLGGFAYYKHNMSSVRNEVRDLLAEYMPLEDGSNDVLA